MKWFMSYVQVYRDGRFKFAHVTYADDEHPVARAARWEKTHGVEDGFDVIVLSFQRVDETCPEVDRLSWGIGS